MKLLKYRALAKPFHTVEVHNGQVTSLWFDNWSSLGRLYDLNGHRGIIDMGITLTSTMAEVFIRRHRQHRVTYLNDIEEAISKVKMKMSAQDDVSFWKYTDDSFKPRFVTKNTWNLLRNHQSTYNWYKGVWFTHATSKYSFIIWLAIQNRLSMGDKMKVWNVGVNTLCSLCGTDEDTRSHLFFGCRISGAIWKKIAFNLLGSDYTDVWDDIVAILTAPTTRFRVFLIRYSFQSTV